MPAQSFPMKGDVDYDGGDEHIADDEDLCDVSLIIVFSICFYAFLVQCIIFISLF